MPDSKAANANLGDRIDFEYANCSRSLPFADGSVDVVVNIESARHYSDRRRFLQEVYRILKPGGKIVASDWMAHDAIPDSHYRKYIEPLCEDWMMCRLESQPSYTRLLQEAGLEVIEFDGFNGMEYDNLHLLTNTLPVPGTAANRLHEVTCFRQTDGSVGKTVCCLAAQLPGYQALLRREVPGVWDQGLGARGQGSE